MKALTTSIALAALILGGAAGAQAAADVKLTIVAKKEITVTGKDGKPKTKLVDPKVVVPGDVIVYLLRYRNEGDKAKEKVVLTDPIPEATAYIAGSAAGAGASIEFSVDGKRFAPEGKVMVKGEDGKLRPADPAEYRVIRWRLKHPLAPGKEGHASFKARVK